MSVCEVESRYPDRPVNASTGDTFAKLCLSIYERLLGLKLDYCDDKASQISIGDTREGYEFKELKNSNDRLHIEFEERTSLSREWVPSGIRCHRKFFVCGSYVDIFEFEIENLRLWARRENPRRIWFGEQCKLQDERHEMATIGSLVLPKKDAIIICSKRFQKLRGKWEVEACVHCGKRLVDCAKTESIFGDHGKYYCDAHRPKEWGGVNG